MTGHHITFFASGNKVHLKWIDKKSDTPAFVSLVKTRMTDAHAPSPSEPAVAESSTDIADQIRQLAHLRDEGLVTEEEFETKRSELIARM